MSKKRSYAFIPILCVVAVVLIGAAGLGMTPEKIYVGGGPADTDGGSYLDPQGNAEFSGNVDADTFTGSNATTMDQGLMSATDKAKLDGIEEGANDYTHPAHTPRSIDTTGVEVMDVLESDSSGHVTNATKRTLPDATTSTPGVMTGADKTKLDGIQASAENFDWTVAGDTGTPQTVDDGQTATIAGGTGIDTSVGGTRTVTVAIENGGVGTTQIADDAITLPKLAQNGATLDDVYKWDGDEWIVGAFPGGVTNFYQLDDVDMGTPADGQIAIYNEATSKMELKTVTGVISIDENGATTFYGPDTDIVTSLGRVKLGYDGTNSDVAKFAHYDHMGATGYAFAQLANGTTYLNAASGQTISFRINNSSEGTWASTGLTIDDDLTVTGNDIIGASGTATVFNTNVTTLNWVGEASTILSNGSVSGGKINGLINTSSGTGSYAEIYIGNTNTQNDSLRLRTLGTGFTTAGAYMQDGAAIVAGVNLTGGLSIGAERSTGDVRIYAGGITDGDLTATFHDDQRVVFPGTLTLGSDANTVSNQTTGKINHDDIENGTNGQVLGSGSSATDMVWMIQPIELTAAAARPMPLIPCGDLEDELAGSYIAFAQRPFDATTSEGAYWAPFRVPPGFVPAANTSVNVYVHWYSLETSKTCTWKVDVGAFAAGESITATPTATVTIDSATGGSAGHEVASGTLDLSGVALADLMFVDVSRLPDDADDNYTLDGLFMLVVIEVKVGHGN